MASDKGRIVMDEEQEDQESNLGWHTMSGETFLEALRRVEAGESPDMVYIEMYANSEPELP